MIELIAKLYNLDTTQVDELLGKTITHIEHHKQTEDIRYDNDALLITCSDGSVYIMTHEQDCCESVYIESICGNLDDLVGAPIVMAEDISSEARDMPKLDEWDDSYTWTFYKFATIKGYVTIRWYGTSNGYYSERVDLYRIPANAFKVHSKEEE